MVDDMAQRDAAPLTQEQRMELEAIASSGRIYAPMALKMLLDDVVLRQHLKGSDNG